MINSQDERLLVIITASETIEQLTVCPKILNSISTEQTLAVYNTLYTTEVFIDLTQILCFNTTQEDIMEIAINIEQMLDKNSIYFLYRHNLYDFVLRSSFKSKIKREV